jgi:sec-independent protein translocase protein TatC
MVTSGEQVLAQVAGFYLDGAYATKEFMGIHAAKVRRLSTFAVRYSIHMPLDQLHEEERQRDERSEMSFFDHISELRRHLLRIALYILVAGLVVFTQKDFIFNHVIFGPTRPDFPTYGFLCQLSEKLGWGRAMCFDIPKFQVIALGMAELLMQHLYISFWLGLILASPLVFREIWMFIKPGLHTHEQRYARGFVFITTTLFVMGVLFGYYVIAPFSISFLTGYTIPNVESKPSLDSYITYLTMFTIPTGLIFQMPIVAYFLARIGLLGPAVMRSYRRHAIVVLLIIAAIITPPDVVSQTLVTIPLYALYEVSILVVGRVKKQRDKAELRGNGKPLPPGDDE